MQSDLFICFHSLILTTLSLTYVSITFVLFFLLKLTNWLQLLFTLLVEMIF